MKGKIFKRVTASVMALTMAGMSLPAEIRNIGLFDSFLISASAAEETVSFIEYEWDGTKTVANTKTVNAEPFPYDSSAIQAGTYFLKAESAEHNGRITLEGNVNLILCDGNKLDVKGLYIPAGSTLTVYGQSAGTGEIYSHPSSGAAIGGYSGHDNGNIVIHGGTINAVGYDNCAGIGSNDSRDGGSITIYGGTVNATGGKDGAAIGGGKNCPGGNITIYGGEITANGPTDSDTCENGAGIGGGVQGGGGNITINGGNITTYSRDGAGIGGGDDGACGTIIINGGTITSTRVNQGQGARIGSGCDGNPGTITINGGTITATQGSGAGIGGGKKSAPGTITINGGTVTTDGNSAGAGIGGGVENKTGGSVVINGGVIKADITGAFGIGSGQDGAEVDVSLSYTDPKNDSIKASTYKGIVTMKKPFKIQYNTNITFKPDVIVNTSINGKTLIPWADINTWWRLQYEIDNLANGSSTISLADNITGNVVEDKALSVPADKKITIDLCGHVLDRGAQAAQFSDNCVLFNKGDLTFTDSKGTGKITGGYAAESNTAGGIVNEGTLTLDGCNVTGNTAEGTGDIDGVYVGGVYVSDGAVLNISGNTKISGNIGGRYGSPVQSNLYLAGNAVINATGQLDEIESDKAQIYVTAQNAPKVITSGLKTNGTIDSFISDDASLGVRATADGEAQLLKLHTVSVADNIENGSVETDVQENVCAGDIVKVTATPADEDNYSVSSVTYTYNIGTEDVTETVEPVDGEYSFTLPDADVTVSAEFKRLYAITVECKNGTVNCKTQAAAGETVDLEPEADDGYELKAGSVKVTDANDGVVAVENGQFVMPASAVTVSAEFEALSQSISAELSGEEYGSFSVSVNGGDAVALATDGTADITGVKTGDTVKVTFQPKDNGRVYQFYLENSNYQEEHHEADIKNNTYSFTMPAEGRKICTRFAYRNEVETVSYTDEFGTKKTAKAAVLTGLEPQDVFENKMRVILGEAGKDTWYYVKDDVSYSSDKAYGAMLSLKGNVNLIIADGKTLTVQESITHNNYVAAGTLNVYGQTAGTGKLVSKSFSAKELNVCSAKYQTSGINAYSVSVLNGSLTVSDDVDCGDGGLTITGGETKINGKVNADKVVLGCRTADDSIYIHDPIKAVNENEHSVSVVLGQTLTDGTNNYSGSLQYSEIQQIAGKTLKLANGSAVDAHLYGHTLSLDGDIGVNFYMELSEATAASETAYMKFTVPTGENTETQTVYVNKQTDTSLPCAVKKTIGNKTYYVFKCRVSAKDMASEINAQMFDGDKAGTEYKYSVKDYADYLLSHTQGNAEYTKAAPLVKAMLNYGAYSQSYFGIEGTAANAELDDADKALGEFTIEHNAPVSSDLPEGVTFEGASLSLESETRLSLYFKNISGDDVTFKLGGRNIEPVENSGYLQINITGIKANQLSQDFTITVGDSGSVTYSPMNYCKTVLEGNYSDSLKNTVKALYKYSHAADSYFA